jgi:hypothetical protein
MPVTIVGNNTPTAGSVVYGDGTNYASTAVGSAGQFLRSNGSSAPSWVAAPSGGFTLGTPVATTSGTAINITGIPAGVRIINVLFKGVSTNGTTNKRLLIGTSAGIETTNYFSNGSRIVNTTVASEGVTSSFVIKSENASEALHGCIQLVLENSSTNSWTAGGVLADIANSNNCFITSGGKSLSGVLDRIQLTANGVDTFDAGEINISYI